jgi:hypothetical protein
MKSSEPKLPSDDNQTRTLGVFLRKSDLDRMVEHPHLGLSNGSSQVKAKDADDDVPKK